MTLDELRASLVLPIIAAPMLLVSGPDLVIGACKAGVVGSFPALNARTPQLCADWLERIEFELTAEREAGGRPAPYAINIILRADHSDRMDSDIELAVRYRAPIVITSVGHPGDTASRIHDYGGLVFHDVASIRHAEKAIEAGVDGLILLTAGAGGHTGHANPFAFVRDVRRFWDGAILLAGGMSDGHAVRAAQVLGADFAYMGTRFAATRESMAFDDYKDLLISQKMADILTTDRISGLPATIMRGSIARAGLDPDNLPPPKARFVPDLPDAVKAWRDVWSAGHGVGLIDHIPGVAELVADLKADYDQACG